MMKDMLGTFIPGEINDTVNYVDGDSYLMHVMLW